MNCSFCRNYIHDHLENLSVLNHPLQQFIRLKRLRQHMRSYLKEISLCLRTMLPYRLPYISDPALPLQQRLLYENSYLEVIESQSADCKKEVDLLVMFLLDYAIVSGPSPILSILARQFLAAQIVYFLENLPFIHDLHQPMRTTSSFPTPPIQAGDEDLYA